MLSLSVFTLFVEGEEGEGEEGILIDSLSFLILDFLILEGVGLGEGAGDDLMEGEREREGMGDADLITGDLTFPSLPLIEEDEERDVSEGEGEGMEEEGTEEEGRGDKEGEGERGGEGRFIFGIF